MRITKTMSSRIPFKCKCMLCKDENASDIVELEDKYGSKIVIGLCGKCGRMNPGLIMKKLEERV